MVDRSDLPGQGGLTLPAAVPETPGSSRARIAEIVSLLISRFHPHRIYLFGSRARGDAVPNSDYDFLMEVDSLPEGVTVTPQSIMWLDELEYADVQVHVRLRDGIAQRMNDPDRVDWYGVREGLLLYAADGFAPLVPDNNSTRVAERPYSPPPKLEEWIYLAEQDLALCEHLSPDMEKWKEPICFHAQQSVEKFLKAAVVRLGRRPPPTHDLEELIDMLELLGADFRAVKQACLSLSRYAITARYPHDDSSFPAIRQIKAAQAKHAIESAELVAAAVRPYLK